MKQTKLSKGQVTDPTVINDTLITQAVREYQIENKIVTNSDEIDFKTIQVLQLSYKNILKIQNLDGLFRLEKLQLDNNLIEQIANLDHLVNLKWLDLSFNCIKEITGLNNLVNITDLSLYNNQIVKVENIEKLTKLNVFSIGNNKLESFDSIIQIFGQKTKIKNCEVINVKGNPFTLKDSEYKLNMIYMIINLKYLDYEFIDEKQKQDVYVSDKFQSDLSHEVMVKTIQNEEETLKEKLALQKDKQLARMDLINNLADELTQDPDLDRVKLLKGVEDEITKFQENIKEIVDQLQKQIIAKNKVKLQNIDKFMEAVQFREKQSYEQTIEILRCLENQKKKVFKKIDDNHPTWRKDADDLLKKISNDKDDLLQIEIQLMEEIDSSIKAFDSMLVILKKEIDEIAKPNNAKIIDLIKEFQSRVMEISKTEFDKYVNIASSNGDLSEWSEETQQILENKETLTAIVSNIKDSLTAKADKKDGEINKCISEDIDNFFKQEKERQYQRNRENVQQIIKETENLQNLIQQRLQKLENEDSDYEN